MGLPNHSASSSSNLSEEALSALEKDVMKRTRQANMVLMKQKRLSSTPEQLVMVGFFGFHFLLPFVFFSLSEFSVVIVHMCYICLFSGATSALFSLIAWNSSNILSYTDIPHFKCSWRLQLFGSTKRENMIYEFSKSRSNDTAHQLMQPYFENYNVFMCYVLWRSTEGQGDHWKWTLLEQIGLLRVLFMNKNCSKGCNKSWNSSQVESLVLSYFQWNVYRYSCLEIRLK